MGKIAIDIQQYVREMRESGCTGYHRFLEIMIDEPRILNHLLYTNKLRPRLISLPVLEL
jgi:hypothetical protein